MADEGTLGVARVEEHPSEDLSKAELQRRLDETRDSISQTVSEIKETVVSQVQAVKRSLDWREQFKKRPVAWTAGALGVGFVAGYGIAAALKSNKDQYHHAIDYYGEQSRSYAASPILGESHETSSQSTAGLEEGSSGPGVFRRIADSRAADKVRNEAASVGDLFVRELGNTAKALVVPALIKSIKEFIGDYLPGAAKLDEKAAQSSRSSERSNYQPILERTQG